MQVYTAAIANRSDATRLDAAAFGLLNSAAVAACDTLDGVEDGVIENPAVCGFDPASLVCADTASGTCLDATQAETARLIYRGPATHDGDPIYPGLARGSEAGWSTLAGDAPLSLAFDTFALPVHGDPDWDWRTFDAATEIPLAVERIGPLMDSNDAGIADFVDTGGKLLLYHGWSDPGIPPRGTIDYFDEVVATLGPEKTGDAVQLFMVPGMNHCAGGTGTDQFDAIAALDRWLDTGEAPDRIEAERRENGEVVRTRPLCAWPSTAVYDGSGDSDMASSFRCE
jgi:feruloyl esterase